MSKDREQTFKSHGIEVAYKFSPSKYDRKFLIVIFSGFRPTGSQYDLDGKGSDTLAANILWIKDSFNGTVSYYIRTAEGFGVSQAVQELIALTLENLGIEKSHCLLAGFSKGGSGALYHGLKYDYPNILATVPRMNIGSANELERPDLLNSLVPDTSLDSIKELDDIIPYLLKNDTNAARNIYLISSKADEQYSTEIAPFLAEYKKYDNFNFILTNSPLVTKHTDVTRYNLQNIYAIMALLTDGIAPKFGITRNGLHEHESRVSRQLPPPSHHNRKIGEFADLSINNHRLFPAGHAFLSGNEASSHNCIQLNLRFKSADQSKKIQLGSVQNTDISSRYFQDTYCDYSFAGFASAKYAGIDISNLPMGVTSLLFEIKHGGESATIVPSSSRIIDSWHIIDSTLIHVLSNSAGAWITRRSPSGRKSKDTIFGLKRLDYVDSRLFVEGHFVQPGIPTPSYGIVKYYLLLKNQDRSGADYTIPLSNGNKSYISPLVNDSFSDYSKSYFTTRRYEGIDLSHVKPAKYDLSISARYGTELFTLDTRHSVSHRSEQWHVSAPSAYSLGVYWQRLRSLFRAFSVSLFTSLLPPTARLKK